MVNEPPVAEAGEDQLVTSSEVHFDGTGSRDPDGAIARYEWDFGDGASGTGADPGPRLPEARPVPRAPHGHR